MEARRQRGICQAEYLERMVPGQLAGLSTRPSGSVYKRGPVAGVLASVGAAAGSAVVKAAVAAVFAAAVEAAFAAAGGADQVRIIGFVL